MTPDSDSDSDSDSDDDNDDDVAVPRATNPYARAAAEHYEEDGSMEMYELQDRNRTRGAGRVRNTRYPYLPDNKYQGQEEGGGRSSRHVRGQAAQYESDEYDTAGEEDDDNDNEYYHDTERGDENEYKSRRQGVRQNNNKSRRRPASVASFQLYTPDEEKAVVRKFDKKLVIFVALLYMLSFLDRSSMFYLFPPFDLLSYVVFVCSAASFRPMFMPQPCISALFVSTKSSNS